MFYPNVYEVKLLKEQEIRERVACAEIDNLARSIRPHRENLISRLLRSVLRSITQMHFVGQRSDARRAEFRAARQSNAAQ